MSLPNYSPEGRVLLGTVPWDNSYKHVRLYQSIMQQQTDIQTLMQTVIETDGYVYVGRDRALKVSLPADRLYHINYCMYKNESMTNQWIYCFVTDVQYINDNTTLLVLETDIFQTYLCGVDWDVPACFVERECVDDDTFGKHLNHEPDFPFEAMCQDTDTIGNLANLDIVLQTTDKPVEFLGAHIASETVKGGMYNNILSGAKMYKFHTNNVQPCIDFLEHLNSAGVGNSVTGLFMLPAEYLPDAGSDYGIPTGTVPKINTYYVNRPTNLHGYVPHNNKLFTFPYSYLRMRHANDASVDLKYELWQERDPGYRITVSVPIDSTMTVFAIPRDYQGINNNTAAMLTYSMDIHCSWIMDSFQTWLGQNGLSVAMSALGGLAGLGVLGKAARKGISGAANGYNKAYTATMANPTVTSGAAMQGAMVRGMGAGAKEAMAPYAKSAGLAAAGVGMFASDIQRHMQQPNNIVGSASGNALAAKGFTEINVENVCILPEFAKIIDTFFDMFGYQVDTVKVPDLWSRPSWNFVKTDGCCARSKSIQAGTTAPFSRGRGTPSDVLAVIRQCFDSGITFWHTTSGFGDFSQDNTL